MTENIRYLNRINQLSENDMRDFIALHRLLDMEMSKSPEEMDLKLIDECSAQIDELAGEGPKHSSAVIQAKIKQILSEPTSRASRNRAKVKAIPAVDTKNRHRVRKFFIILAASLLLLYSSLTVAAKIQGYGNAWSFIANKIVEIFNLNTGEEVSSENITLVMDDDHTDYANIEDLLNCENLDILYPSTLPDGTYCTTIQKKIRNNHKLSYLFIFNNKDLHMIANTYYSFDLTITNNLETHVTEYGEFYIKDLQNGVFQAICQLDGYEYLITYTDYKTLIQIIQNMKGFSS